jgi:hypothetical protein
MPSYANSKVYAIKSFKTPNVYIGATTQTLSRRLSGHKRTHNKEKGQTSASHILQHGDAYIELLEDFPCNSKRELDLIEASYIRNTEHCVNVIMADSGLTIEGRSTIGGGRTPAQKASQRAYRLRKTMERKQQESVQVDLRRDRLNIETVKRYQRGYKKKAPSTNRRNVLHLYNISWDKTPVPANKRKVPFVHKS